jgi:hypothetical protein
LNPIALNRAAGHYIDCAENILIRQIPIAALQLRGNSGATAIAKNKLIYCIQAFPQVSNGKGVDRHSNAE